MDFLLHVKPSKKKSSLKKTRPSAKIQKSCRGEPPEEALADGSRLVATLVWQFDIPVASRRVHCFLLLG